MKFSVLTYLYLQYQLKNGWTLTKQILKLAHFVFILVSLFLSHNVYLYPAPLIKWIVFPTDSVSLLYDRVLICLYPACLLLIILMMTDCDHFTCIFKTKNRPRPAARFLAPFSKNRFNHLTQFKGKPKYVALRWGRKA